MTTRVARPGCAAVRVHACAKINLTLRVLGLRTDGYHELRTVLQSIALHDTLTCTATDGPFEITTSDPDCPADPTNLVWKAAERLWIAARRRGALSRVRVHIEKRIPAAAGLGGGSSDAAATLRALRALWGLPLQDDRLVSIGSLLGADVPFFLTGGTMLGLERGEIVYPLEEAPAVWVVIARPDFGVSTADAYAWWDEANADRNRAIRAAAAAGGSRVYVNDLQPEVARRHPTIHRLVRRLEHLGAGHAAMSGSGSAVFGLFDLRETARRAADALSGRTVSSWLTRTTSRPRHARLGAVAPLRR